MLIQEELGILNRTALARILEARAQGRSRGNELQHRSTGEWVAVSDRTPLSRDEATPDQPTAIEVLTEYGSAG